MNTFHVVNTFYIVTTIVVVSYNICAGRSTERLVLTTCLVAVRFRENQNPSYQQFKVVGRLTGLCTIVEDMADQAKKAQTSFVDGATVAGHWDQNNINTKAARTKARKVPPAEKLEAIRLRTQVILSFWAVILCMGLPMWWQTTSVYRARLPISQMLERAGLPVRGDPV